MCVVYCLLALYCYLFPSSSSSVCPRCWHIRLHIILFLRCTHCAAHLTLATRISQLTTHTCWDKHKSNCSHSLVNIPCALPFTFYWRGNSHEYIIYNHHNMLLRRHNSFSMSSTTSHLEDSKFGCTIPQ
jgi:hypothetical protein